MLGFWAQQGTRATWDASRYKIDNIAHTSANWSKSGFDCQFGGLPAPALRAGCVNRWQRSASELRVQCGSQLGTCVVAVKAQ